MSKVDKDSTIDVEKRVEDVNAMLLGDAPPERCYPDEPEGKSGNRKLGISCSYCPFKHTCWADSNGGRGLRTFAYSTGVKFMTHINKEPRVEENVV